MPYQIEMINDDVLALQFSGESDATEHLRSRDEATNLCREKGLTRVLVDMSKQTMFMASETMDLYKFGESMVEGSFPKHTWIAVITSSSVQAGKDVQFVVTVARNRGFMVHLFHEPDAALQWLRQ